jgi:hypothetical protein
MYTEFNLPNKLPVEKLREEYTLLIGLEGPDGYVAMELQLLNDLEERLPNLIEKAGSYSLMKNTCLLGITRCGMDSADIDRRINSAKRIFGALEAQYKIQQ